MFSVKFTFSPVATVYILDFSTGAGTDEDTNETVLGEAIKFDVTTAGYWTNAN